MFFLFVGITTLLLLNFIITPALWCGLSKIFKIEDVTFRKALFVCLLLTLIGVLLQLIPFGLSLVKINSVFIDLILSIVSIIFIISIIKIKFNTTILKSIGLYVSTIILAVCLALSIRIFVVQAYKLPAGSMKNTLMIGDHILVNKFIYNFKSPKRGEIIVFRYPNDPKKDFVKRVIGLEGDIIEIKNKQLFLNGELLNEDYIIHNDTRIIKTRDILGPIKVPKNSYFVMGDNRDNSHDSRFWGFVDSKEIKGRAFIIYWSWDKHVEKNRWDRIGVSL